MTLPRVSVCVVSWHRPEALQRCVAAIRQLQYPEFELVVVADAAGLSALPRDLAIKRVEAQQANISIARNLAIAQAAGDIIAFIDDDAVPEPTWLGHLCAPFWDSKIAATGGYVRARNGISWQWRGRVVNRLGETRDHIPEAAVPDGFALKTEGTNMAVRRDVLVALGGFDPAFHFLLDETDLNLRLQHAGYHSALAPKAEVHHGYFASARRRRDRVPTDLFQIGASWAVFLNKHAAKAEREARLRQLREMEHGRLIRHLISGGLEPRDVRYLRARFDAGIEEGATREAGVSTRFSESPAFLRFPAQKRALTHFVCNRISMKRTLKKAEARVVAGEVATIFNLSFTGLYHNIEFTREGVWIQTGGVFGKSERNQPLFWLWRREERVKAELDRVAHARNIAY